MIEAIQFKLNGETVRLKVSRSSISERIRIQDFDWCSRRVLSIPFFGTTSNS